MFRFGDPGGRLYGTVGASNANLLSWWTTAGTTTATWSVQSGGGRTGASSLRLTYGNNSFSNFATKVLDSQATWGAALGIKINALPNSSMAVAAFLDSTSIQCDVRIDPIGTLSCTRNGTVLGTTAGLVIPNSYVHLELKATIHPSAGTVGLWVNGTQRLNLTGINTRNTANSSANVVAVGMVTAAGNGTTILDFDDIIIYDGQATDAFGNADITGPIGDCRLGLVNMLGAGAVTQFTPLGGGSNAGCVADLAGPDGDATCVQSGTVGQSDLYTTTGVPSSATVVKSFAVVQYARKTDAGVRTIAPMIQSAGGNSVHPANNTLGTNYQYFFNNWGQNPNNGSPTGWTPSGINAIQVGQQVTG